MLADLPREVVAADMERIFGPLGERQIIITPRQPHVSGGKSGSRKQTALRYIIIALTVLALMGAGIVGYRLIAVQDFLRQTTGWPAVQLQIPAIFKDRSSDAPVPEHTSISPVSPVSPSDATVDTRAILPPSPPLPQTQTQTQTKSPSPPGPRIKAPLSSNIVDDSVDDVPVPDRRTAAPLQRDCPPGSEENRCIYQDVMAADARLRLAYKRARQAGVAENILRTTNLRWRQALQRSQDAPDLAIERYNRLATMLDQQREEINH